MQQKEACMIYSILAEEYLGKDTNLNFLDFDNPFQILIMTILSAQTTDIMVNSVKSDLFSGYPDAYSLSKADKDDVERIIKKTGFFRAKTKNIIAASKILCNEFSGEVPRTMEELTSLPGVGRKTSNIVLNHAFGIDEGIAVDTHVKRVSKRIGFTDNTDPDRIEKDLTETLPKKVWGKMNYLLISHGRSVCTARKPACERCAIKKYCRFFHENNI